MSLNASINEAKHGNSIMGTKDKDISAMKGLDMSNPDQPTLKYNPADALTIGIWGFGLMTGYLLGMMLCAICAYGLVPNPIWVWTACTVMGGISLAAVIFLFWFAWRYLGKIDSADLVLRYLVGSLLLGLVSPLVVAGLFYAEWLFKNVNKEVQPRWRFAALLRNSQMRAI